MSVLLLQYRHIVGCDPTAMGFTVLREASWVQDHRRSTVTPVVCTRDPDRWTTVTDEGAKALCRACPRRWRCAQEACQTPGAEGVWAGILIPEGGRGRGFALKQLRSLAELNGFPVPHK
jgi:WhiB family redox-sensing transcriptional regulator